MAESGFELGLSRSLTLGPALTLASALALAQDEFVVLFIYAHCLYVVVFVCKTRFGHSSAGISPILMRI